MDTVRYGVIGTGMMGVEHIENLRRIEGVEVTAICDTHPGSRQFTQAVLDAPVPEFSDHRELLASDLVDAVVIATPNMTHVDVLLDTIAAGVPTLVEKPLCTTVDDCRRVIEAATAAEAFVWVGLEYRYMPPITRLIDEVRSGAVGDLKMIAIREHRFPFLDKVDNWNRFTRNTGGTLVEKCCHFFDLMNLIADARPVRVLASGAQDVNHLDESYEGEVPDILDNAFVIVDYENGVRALLDLCMFAEGSKEQGEVLAVGDLGKVEAFTPSLEFRRGRRDGGRDKVEISTVDDDRILYEGHHHGSSYLEHLDLRDALREGRPPLVALEDGLWSVAVGVAAHRSIDEGRPVTIDEVLNPT